MSSTIRMKIQVRDLAYAPLLGYVIVKRYASEHDARPVRTGSRHTIEIQSRLEYDSRSTVE